MNSHFKNFNTSNTSFTLREPHKGGFRVIADTTRNHIFFKRNQSINKTNDLILNLTPENVTQHSRIVTTTRKGSSTPTKMS